MLQEIKNSLETLQQDKVLLYPTDTVWGIGCDATSEPAVKKIYNIKQRAESKSLIILVDSVEMLQHYVPTISNKIIKLLTTTSKPTTIIYNKPKGLAKNVVAADNTVAIRIVQNKFCQELIAQFGKPIVSTSANVSGNETPKSFKEIEESILNSVDYSVNLQREAVNEKSSTILKVAENGDISVLRE
ncbi:MULTISPECIES: L-threonylcarbamoyladenylate synthase [Flavobacteriaceae]|uniref:L-threonylcarbamoyladenylate synthase n=2 Tax=Flavobacteriaceae TaxID=49546 RepID=A0A4Y8AWP7_9FLAO|nr:MULTISPECIES: L-threonylcarbamoyladenylate synthase [Flavobacteriaceae]TEW76565.1 threonylcarbamoyl-AMP synthase [Gramella jeungdoensis]GGK54059.1 translation factor Sua5 [Lutibacter litoralis]